jgi:hypothetical protein
MQKNNHENEKLGGTDTNECIDTIFKTECRNESIKCCHKTKSAY